ncbi:hypothetical protein [Nocardia huaxiensis]|uniref:hypothetical protein n=1 Tax=Nocardia huaxiensis TaxID=2755382 RepID=UPI001C67D412|nr:hypothetical protein [Nocardia huaxiensis]UFS95398.1 hypothetical protein LPY97_32725 [Nocardia huaxiensis]
MSSPGGKSARLSAVIAILLLAAVGCAKDTEPAPPSGFWFTEPRNDDQRLEVLRRQRAVDPCALLPRAELEKYGPVRSVRHDQPNTCEVNAGSDQPGKGTGASLAVIGGTLQGSGKGVEKTVAGVPASFLADRDGVDAADFAKTVLRSCQVTSRFPAGGGLMMLISTELGTEPCPVAESLLAVALTEWMKEPPRGTAPETVRTILTNADPCAVLSRLGATVDAAHRRMQTCDFAYRGDEVTVNYDYQEERLAFDTERDELLAGARYPVYRKVLSEYTFHTAVLGPVIDPALPDSRIPIVSVSGANSEVVAAVMDEVLTLFP